MKDQLIDISKLNKADVLAALYNNSRQQGLGFINPNGRHQMTKADAEVLLEEGDTFFDYLRGRVMKVDIGRDTLDPWGYDRDNGEGAAARALAPLQKTMAA